MACILLWSSAVRVHDSQAYTKMDMTWERISHILELREILLSFHVRVHGSQAYRKMDVTRERISHILELREILLSFQSGVNLANAAVVCAILESILGLEPSSVITEPRHLKLLTVSNFCPFYCDSCVDATGVVCHQPPSSRH